MKTCVVLLFGASLWAQIDQPKLGWMLDSSGAARPVFGISGSVTLGDPAVAGALSSGCSAGFCLVKTDTSIVSATGSTGAPAGPALFAFDGNAAFVYFLQSKQLARWHDDQLDSMDFDVAGEILSIHAMNNALLFAVRRDDGTWIVRDGNIVAHAVPRATGPVLLLDGGVLYATAGAIVLRRADASELRFRLAGAEVFSQLGAGYVQVRAGGSMYAVRVDSGREQLFQLPEPAQ